jgi:hypothetical protein
MDIDKIAIEHGQLMQTRRRAGTGAGADRRGVGGAARVQVHGRDHDAHPGGGHSKMTEPIAIAVFLAIALALDAVVIWLLRG